MNDKLEYKGYTGSINYCANDKILYGKIDVIKPCLDIISYEGSSVYEIEKSFQEAIEDYYDSLPKPRYKEDDRVNVISGRFEGCSGKITDFDFEGIGLIIELDNNNEFDSCVCYVNPNQVEHIQLVYRDE